MRRPLSPAFAETAGFGIRLAPLADVNQETLFRDRERDVTAQLVVGDSKNTAPWRGPRPICDEFEAYGYRRIGAELRHRGLVLFFSSRRGGFLPVNPLHLLGEYEPTGRHLFECALYGQVLCLRRAIFCVVRPLSVHVRP